MPPILLHPQMLDSFSSEKAAKKSKVDIFISMSGVDVLESKTKVRAWSAQNLIRL